MVALCVGRRSGFIWGRGVRIKTARPPLPVPAGTGGRGRDAAGVGGPHRVRLLAAPYAGMVPPLAASAPPHWAGARGERSVRQILSA